MALSDRIYPATKAGQDEIKALITARTAPLNLANMSILLVNFLDSTSLTITKGYLYTDAREIRTR